MSRIVIDILIYQLHKPTDKIKMYLNCEMKVWTGFIWLRVQGRMADCCGNTVMKFRLL
jgi:hypothetical protein